MFKPTRWLQSECVAVDDEQNDLARTANKIRGSERGSTASRARAKGALLHRIRVTVESQEGILDESFDQSSCQRSKMGQGSSRTQTVTPDTHSGLEPHTRSDLLGIRDFWPVFDPDIPRLLPGGLLPVCSCVRRSATGGAA
jgi:hypothetical protein